MEALGSPAVVPRLGSGSVLGSQRSAPACPGWHVVSKRQPDSALTAKACALAVSRHLFAGKRKLLKSTDAAVSLRTETYVEETPEQEQDLAFEDVPGEPSSISIDIFGAPADRAELHAIRMNSMRQKLLRKLSEANQHNRALQRTLQNTNDTLLKCKAELATMEMELRVLVDLAQEIEQEGAKPGTRKINGKYIHSHLAQRLEDIFDRLALQIQDVDAVRLRDIQVQWYSMAEDVRVMGSFDGWTEGEQLSPEHMGVCTKFTGLLKLRPGHYQIKFLVDGTWQVSPELPTVGEGLTVNNLLVVE